MAMSYTQIEVSRAAVRVTLLDHLREKRERLVLPPPSHAPDAVRYWFDATKKAGMSAEKLADETYQRLIESGAARCTEVPVSDSRVMSAYDAHNPLQTKLFVLEEIFELIRAGVLMQVRLVPQHEGRSFDFLFSFGTGHLMLTDQGERFLAEDLAPPYFTEPYLARLRQIAEPDDELQGYLSEGLACLRNHLGRAAAMLLRITAEHTLNTLIESTTVSIGQDKELQKFRGQVRSAGIRIGERAEVVFKKLESSRALLPSKPNFRNMLSQRLRPAFHSIRVLGGNAAHLASPIRLGEVADHYTLYASSVYPITVSIIEHQKTL